MDGWMDGSFVIGATLYCYDVETGTLVDPSCSRILCAHRELSYPTYMMVYVLQIKLPLYLARIYIIVYD
eukprot:scaffold1519_cov166-Amphora_coffeaeformis.AAC.20